MNERAHYPDKKAYFINHHMNSDNTNIIDNRQNGIQNSFINGGCNRKK